MDDDHEGIFAKLRAAGQRMRAAAQLELDRRGIVRMHQFPDGRVLTVRKQSIQNRDSFSFRIVNKKTGFSWDDGVGYRFKQDCVKEAEQIFGVQRWNVL